MRTCKVLRAGLLTTVQDGGRHGFRHLGLARCGALDAPAAWLGNRLVGNPVDAAVLEITLAGPRLHFDVPVHIALTGAPLRARWQGKALPMNRPVMLPAGELDLQAITGGVRSYLAIAGGFPVTEVMGSRSTDLRAGFGGWHGRALHAGDTLPIDGRRLSDPGELRAATWWIGDDTDYSLQTQRIRYVPESGPADGLAGRAWTVSGQCNRQGLRLHGDALDSSAATQLSEPVAPGTIQLPADGQPIVLLADAQTVGGYARLGHVIAADLPLLAQAGTGKHLVFEAVDLRQAHQAACLNRQRMARIELALARVQTSPSFR